MATYPGHQQQPESSRLQELHLISTCCCCCRCCCCCCCYCCCCCCCYYKMHLVTGFLLIKKIDVCYALKPGLWSQSRRLGLETVSRRTSVSSRFRLEKNCQCLSLVSVSGGRCLGLGHFCLVPKTNFRPNCAPQYAV